MRYLTLALFALCAFGQSGRINAGGAAYTDTLGQVWAADNSFVGGAVSTGPVPSGAPAYFSTKRYGDFTYTLAVPDGQYTGGLSFLENVVLPAGGRVFSVTINGAPFLTNYDAVSDVGAMVPVRKTFSTVAAGHGITIKFITVARSAFVNAIDFSLVPVWVPPTCTFAAPPASPQVGQACVFLDADLFRSCTGAALGRPAGQETCRWTGDHWQTIALPIESPLFPFTSSTSRPVECTGGQVPFTAINAGTISVEYPIFTVDASVRWDQITIAETEKFLPAVGLSVSMGRPGTNHIEMTGAGVPLGESSNNATPWTARPNPPQLTGAYAVVLNFQTTDNHLLQELTAGSVYWEACGYRVGPMAPAPAHLASVKSCSGSGSTTDPVTGKVTTWDCSGLWGASIVLPDGSALPLVGVASPGSERLPGTVWSVR